MIPEISHSCFPEIRNPPKGTCTRPPLRRRQSPNRQNLFSGNKKPPKRDMQPPENRLFGTNPHKRGLRWAHAPLPYMVSRNDRQKSSANYLVPRVFAQKGFDISIFGHFFCPFSENFIESCRVKIKNNKIILQDLL